MIPDPYESELKKVRLLHRERKLSAIAPEGGARTSLSNKELRLFSGNDYLGLSVHPSVRSATINAVERFGMGPRGSALMCGYTEVHDALAERIANLKGTTSAVLFPTGYQANLGLLSALGHMGGTIFSDALNHASIIDGCRMAKCPIVVYPHGDMTALEQALKDCKSKRKVVVTDEVFSMDGDGAPLQALATLKTRYGFTLITDSAHASGIYGVNGGGWAQACNAHEAVDFHVGTLSKAFSSQGGFVACSKSAHDWLINTARTFIYTTAVPVPIAAAAGAAIDVSISEPEHRENLWKRVAQIGELLSQTVHGPIIPIHVGTEQAALMLAQSLLEGGFHVPAVRPPTVPDGQCRLRIALSAAHGREDVNALVDALRISQKILAGQDKT